jgi:hypothetical protein
MTIESQVNNTWVVGTYVSLNYSNNQDIFLDDEFDSDPLASDHASIPSHTESIRAGAVHT